MDLSDSVRHASVEVTSKWCHQGQRRKQHVRGERRWYRVNNQTAQKRPVSFALRPVSRAGPVAMPKCWEEIRGLFVVDQKQILRPLIANATTSHWDPSSKMSVISSPSRGTRLIGSGSELQSASSSSLQYPHWSSFTRQGPNTNTLQPERHWAVCPFPQPAQDCCSRRQPWSSSYLLSALDPELLRDKHMPGEGRFSARVMDSLRGFTLAGGVTMPWKAGDLSHATCHDMLGFMVPLGLCSSSNFPTIFTLVEFHFLCFPMIRRLGCGRQGSLKEPEGVALICFILVFISLTQDQPAVKD